MTGLLLLGAGGHSRVVAETALSTGRFDHLAFLDDHAVSPPYSDHFGWPILGKLSDAFEPSVRRHFQHAVVSIGSSSIRLRWLSLLSDAGYDLPVLTHSSAWLSPSAVVGPGSVIFAQAAVQAKAVIGRGVILNTSCSIDHDVKLGDGVHICPGANLAGCVHVGDHSWIGIGSSVIQKICIGSGVIIGAGASVISNVPDNVVSVGVPARILSSN